MEQPSRVGRAVDVLCGMVEHQLPADASIEINADPLMANLATVR